MHTRWVVWSTAAWFISLAPMASAENPAAGAPQASHALALASSTREQPQQGFVDQLVSQYRTPKRIAAFLHDRFIFKRDEDLFGKADHWQSPEEFLARQAGDCEDYALLAQALLARLGIKAYVLSVFGEGGYAHTVCVFLDERGRYNVMDVARIRYVHATSLEALASWLYPAWTAASVAERAETHGRAVRELSNPHPASFQAFAGTIPITF